jgi:hypothetical protein
VLALLGAVLAVLLAGAAAPLARRAPSPVVTGVLVVAFIVLTPRVRADRSVVAKFVAELHGDPAHHEVLRHLEEIVRETPGTDPVRVENRCGFGCRFSRRSGCLDGSALS